MPRDTRERLLDTAETLFAEHGFDRVSITAIANELGVTRQALLHHFGTKERLYAEVLGRISDYFETLGAEQSRYGPEDPAERLTAYFLALQAPTPRKPERTRLLMRELLDNMQRTKTNATWYLKPFLEDLVTMVRQVPNWSDASEAEALALAYQWLGAINYYVVSAPSLEAMLGKARFDALAQAHPRQLRAMIRASLATR